VGEVIDVATEAGANSVQNIQFGLKDEAAVKARALREAATDARRKADALADALGLEITGIFSVIEGEPDVVRPMPAYREMAMAQAASAPTPVEPGTIEFRASVTLVVGIRP
ncbi:MAG: SIMPL domain-containing protein, partial [Vicinamibacteria bacterium]